MTVNDGLKPSSSVEADGSCQLETSVAMCTYNGTQFLQEQLESIAWQTRLPGELVVCDDGSTDGRIALINEFSRKAPFPVRFYRNSSKLGPAKNFEKAISLCEGQIILLSDQDDIWVPEKVEKLLKVLAARPEAVYVFSDAQFIGQNGEALRQTLWSALKLRPSDFVGARQVEILLKANVVTGAGLAFRSSLREIALPIPPGWMHDYWIGLLGSVISEGIPVAEVFYKYRRHAAQVCGWRKRNGFQIIRDSLASDGENMQQKVQQFQALIERLYAISSSRKIDENQMELLREKEFHLKQRAMVRSTRGFSRICKVFVEASSGRYNRFSDSFCSLARDLFG